MADPRILPQYVSLKYGGKYLRYMEENGDRLQFLSDEVINPLTRLEVVVSSKEDEDDKVHLRCCYNNKFLVRAASDSDFIVARAEEPEEDQSTWSCTLFVPQYGGGGGSGTFVFFLPGKQSYLCSTTSSGSTINDSSCLAVGYSNVRNIFGFTDLSSLVILPSIVVFKGDNNKYLRSKTMEGHEYLEFEAAKGDESFVDPEFRYEAYPTPEGNYRFKSVRTKKFWRRDTPNPNNWVWADSTDTSNSDPNTIFKPVRLPPIDKDKVGEDTNIGFDKDNCIALLCTANNQYCIRRTADTKWDCLDAKETAVIKEARIRVEEALLARQIKDVEYRLDEGKVYDFSDVKTMTTYVTNEDPINSLVLEVSYTYSETQSVRWASTNSWKFGVSTTIKAGIPVLAEGGISINSSYDGSIEWSEDVTDTIELYDKASPTVGPGKKHMVKLVVATVAMDVPFSYTQVDKLMDGSPREDRMHDGSYKTVMPKYQWRSTPL